MQFVVAGVRGGQVAGTLRGDGPEKLLADRSSTSSAIMWPSSRLSSDAEPFRPAPGLRGPPPQQQPRAPGRRRRAGWHPQLTQGLRAGARSAGAQADARDVAAGVAGDAGPGVAARVEAARAACAQAGVRRRDLRLAGRAHVAGVAAPAAPAALLEGCLPQRAPVLSWLAGDLLAAHLPPLLRYRGLSFLCDVQRAAPAPSCLRGRVQIRASGTLAPRHAAPQRPHLKVGHLVSPHQHAQVLDDRARLQLRQHRRGKE